MTTLTYPYDPSGVEPANLVKDELRSVQPPAESGKPNFIIAKIGPYFESSLEIWTGTNKTGKRLVLGTDYFVTHKFVAGTTFLGNPLAGGICFTNSLYKGNVYLTYQTLGGDFTVADHTVLEELTRRIYNNILTVTWDQLEGVPSAFPPDAHTHPVTKVATFDDLCEAIKNIAQVLVSSSSTSGGDAGSQALALISSHLLATQNAHTPSAVGLSNLRNYPIASFTDASDFRNDRYVTPLTVSYMFGVLTNNANPDDLRADVEQIQADIITINKSISTINSQISNINTSITQVQQRVTACETSITAMNQRITTVAETAGNALTVAGQAMAQSVATDANMNALAERTERILYADNGLLVPGTHKLVIPAGTSLRVELIGGGAGSGKWFSLSSDASLTGGAITHGEDSVLWYMGNRNVALEPIPLLVVGGGKAGLNSYGNIGRSAGGAGGTARRFRTEQILLSTVKPSEINLANDLILASSEYNGTTGVSGDTVNTQSAVEGVGGFKIDTSGDGYHQTYGKGCSGTNKAGAGGSGAKCHVILRNDTGVDAIIMIRVGKAGVSARSSVTDETTFNVNDLISTSGVGLLTLVS